jgi:hypothetical protein
VEKHVEIASGNLGVDTGKGSTPIIQKLSTIGLTSKNFHPDLWIMGINGANPPSSLQPPESSCWQ